MNVITCDQRSPEWHQARLGKLTGSVVGEAFATIKGGAWGAGRRNLRIRLVLERLTGRSQENGFHSADMDRGIELEDAARRAYEAETGRLVEPVGFVQHDALLTGCSPDGVIGSLDAIEGVIEIKAPKAATHLDYLRGGLPRDYYLQIVHSLWLTGATWGDFASYCPEFPDALRLKITRVTVTDAERAAHELAVRLFLSECEKEEHDVRALVAVPA